MLHFKQASRDLRGSEDAKLVEPIIAQSKFSNRCFTFAAPRLYNALPVEVRQAETIESFKNKLKTFLFTQSYDLDNLCIKPDFRL